jgi:hypothetical protein
VIESAVLVMGDGAYLNWLCDFMALREPSKVVPGGNESSRRQACSVSIGNQPNQIVFKAFAIHFSFLFSSTVSMSISTNLYKIANKQIKKPAPIAFGMNEPWVALPS